jgi:hypothetical protein
MRRSITILLALFCLVVLTAAPLGAADEVPFKTKATVTSASDLFPIPELCGDPALGVLGQVVEYSGTGTHLGRFEMVETICLDLGALDPPLQPILAFEVFGTVYAANGDELTFYVDGIMNVLTNEVDDGGFDFTGGTGRFESAHGHGEAVLLRDSAGDLIGNTMTGTITYSASDRSQ